MQPNSDGKASPGSPFKPPAARIWNNMVDAGRAHADSLLNGGAPNPIRPRETDIIKVKNNSGAIRRTGEILRISGKALGTVTAENPWLLGVEPTDDGFFGILKEPAAVDGISSLQVSGCCLALVNVTDAGHTRATAADTEYVLQSGDDGPIEILYAPDGTGEKNCVVRFAGSGGSGVQTIRFEISQQPDCATCQAVARVLSRPPGVARVAEEDDYGELRVYDLCRGWLHRPDIDLFDPVSGDGARGYATRLTWDAQECAINPDLDTKWEIISLLPLDTGCA